MKPDLKLAMLAAQMCDLSYHAATISDALTDTQVLIQDSPEFTFVAFRGSSSLKDWITDCEIFRAPYAEGEVHRGFLRAITSVRVKVALALLGRNKPVVVTGHSLGGALAMLFADWMTREGRHIDAVYTFGQPRVGNGKFAAAYDGRLREATFRFINAQDAVPRLPGWLAGYRHAGTRMFFTFDGELLVSPSLARMAISDVFGIVNDWFTRRELSTLTNHGLGRYLDQLASFAPEYNSIKQ